MTANIVTNAEAVLEGAFLARAVYGGTSIAAAFDDTSDNERELADDYRGYLASQGNWQTLTAAELPTFDGKGVASFTAGGLYTSKVDTGVTNSNDAQGLLAVHGDTLVLAFRGTDDEDPSVESGQAFVGSSLAANYKAFRPLIKAALDYVEAHDEIENIVVSGHSLGGALVDIFALADAAKFRELRPDGLTMVSIASSGVAADLPVFLSGLDHDAATIEDKIVEIGGIEFEVPEIVALNPPTDYIAIANADDRVRFATDHPNVPEAPGLVPIATLKDNLHFGGDIVFSNPNIANTDVIYYDPFDRPLDFRGFGAEHNRDLYWSNVQALLNDPLNDNFEGQAVIVGLADYNQVPDFNGDPVQLFEGYVDRDDLQNDWDAGDHALKGSAAADYILGQSGNDRLGGASGNDLLSGGTGKDTLTGGKGHDILNGGTGADRFSYSAVNQSRVGEKHDLITDFSHAQHDKIDLSALGSLTFVTGDFTGAGQVHAIEAGGQTLIQADIDGDGEPDLEVALAIPTVPTAADFIL